MSNGVLLDQSTIALIALLVGIVGSTLGAFAYISGELRKSMQNARDNDDDLKEALGLRIDQVAASSNSGRESLRAEILQTVGHLQTEVRTMGERVVRRDDMEQLEARLTRGYERMDRKLDELSSAVARLLVQGVRRIGIREDDPDPQ